MKLADWEVEHWARVYSSAIGGMFSQDYVNTWCPLNAAQSKAAADEADHAIELLRERLGGNVKECDPSCDVCSDYRK